MTDNSLTAERLDAFIAGAEKANERGELCTILPSTALAVGYAARQSLASRSDISAGEVRGYVIDAFTPLMEDALTDARSDDREDRTDAEARIRVLREAQTAVLAALSARPAPPPAPNASLRETYARGKAMKDTAEDAGTVEDKPHGPTLTTMNEVAERIALAAERVAMTCRPGGERERLFKLFSDEVRAAATAETAGGES